MVLLEGTLTSAIFADMVEPRPCPWFAGGRVSTCLLYTSLYAQGEDHGCGDGDRSTEAGKCFEQAAEAEGNEDCLDCLLYTSRCV